MVYHVNDCVAVTSNLTYQLNTRMDAVDRAMEMYVRLTALPEDTKLPKDVASFIDAYSMYCDGVEELQDPTALMALSEALIGNLKVAMVRINKTLDEVLNVIVNSQARNKKQFIDMQNSIGQRANDPDVVKRFEAIPCKVLSQADSREATERSRKLVELIRFVSGSQTAAASRDILMKGQAAAGIAFTNGNQITDMYTSVAAGTYSSFSDGGWTIAGLSEIVKSHIELLDEINGVRDSQKQLKAQANQLASDIENIQKTGVTNANAKLIQDRILFQIFTVRMVSSCVAILIKRVAAVSNILKAINIEVERAALDVASAK